MAVLYVFIVGLCVGSFLNVLIDRLPIKESILGRSHCESCKKELKWRDLIPVLSFVYLKGRCRYCHTPLSYQYPLVELLTGILFVIAFIYISNGAIFPPKADQPLADNFQLIYYLFIVSVMIVIFFADLRHGIIPDKILMILIMVILPYLFIIHNSLFLIHFVSAIGAFLSFLFIYLITRGRGMGFGDVKLSFLIGLILGFPNIILALYVAFLTGGAVGIILILWKKKSLKSSVPFGPFLVIGCLISLFFADIIIPRIYPYLGVLP